MWLKNRDYTNLDHEITGAYYKQKNTLADYIIYAVGIVVVIAIIDLFFPEAVTNLLADIVLTLR